MIIHDGSITGRQLERTHLLVGSIKTLWYIIVSPQTTTKSKWNLQILLPHLQGTEENIKQHHGGVISKIQGSEETNYRTNDRIWLFSPPNKLQEGEKKGNLDYATRIIINQMQCVALLGYWLNKLNCSFNWRRTVTRYLILSLCSFLRIDNSILPS